MTTFTFAVVSGQKGFRGCVLPCLPDMREGDAVRVRLKAARTGAVAEYVTILKLPYRKSKNILVPVPPGTAGVESGDTVAIRVTQVDLDGWFESDSSEPMEVVQ